MKQFAVTATQYVTSLVMSVAVIWVVTTATLHAAEIQVGRYSVLTSSPQEQADLFTPTTIQFSEQIQTVGDAVRDLVERNDYRLIAIESIEADTATLFTLPLPSSDRSLGPLSLRQALQTLAGASFRVVLDPVTRTVIFDRPENEINSDEQGSRDE